MLVNLDIRNPACCVLGNGRSQLEWKLIELVDRNKRRECDYRMHLIKDEYGDMLEHNR